MIVATWEEFLAGRTAAGPALRERPCRLTVGVFDGLHLGHRRLVAAITGTGAGDAAGTTARPSGDEPRRPLPVVVTFRRPPGQVLGTTGAPGLILSLPQRLRRMASLGVGLAVLIDFSEEISTLSGRDFVDLLRARLAIERIVVGLNFRFGWKRNADVRDLEAMLAGPASPGPALGPTTLQVIAPVLLGGEAVSSSRIRRAVRDGDLEGAATMLAAPHEIDLGGLPGGPTAEVRLARPEVAQVLPSAGRHDVTGHGPDGAVPGTLEAAGDAVVVRFAREARFTTFTFGRERGNERSPRDGIDG